MFEVGFTEIILILGIALVVLGPEKLPKVAADIGRWVGRARAMARQFKSQLDEEVIKTDRDWSRPEPPRTPPRRSGLEDLDASPNRAAPPPPTAGTASTTAAPEGGPAPAGDPDPQREAAASTQPAGAAAPQEPADTPPEPRAGTGSTDGA